MLKKFTKILVWLLVATIVVGTFSIAAPKKARAATFSMQTGYYIGTGASLAITGVGFQPDLVIVKADTTAGVGGVWKSSNMAANTTAYFPATANDSSTMITFNSDGFTLSSAANVNTVNVVWKWIAFAGSGCASDGTFCVGSYTGNGGASQEISSVGFLPDLVWVKGSGTTAATWRSSSMADSVGQYFTATTQNTTGGLFTTLDSDGFTVGLTNNANTIVYQYVAFKKVSTAMNVGTYTGNGTSQSISSMGFTPDWVFVKNANAATAVAPVFNLTETFGNYSSLFTDAACATTHITSLDSDGFSVGASSNANGSTNTLYWASFGGAANPSGSGSFQMDTGSYTGTGATLNITGLDFKPDLVIIKQASDPVTPQMGVFRTKMMPGDSTAYLSAANANFTGGITSLNSDGFTLGTSAITNANGDTYYWTAFGNAFDPFDSSGAADFAVGAYYGNGIDSRNITRVPFQPDLVAAKRSGGTSGAWRSSQNSGDQSAFFAATAETTNVIQTFNADGFQIGTAANTNTAANIYWWFAFKSGSYFTVNTYSGTGSAQNITTAGFRPDLVWIKRTTGVNGVFRPGSLGGDATQYFNNLVNASDRITDFIPNGFSLGGSQTETNTSGGSYRYAAWGKAYTISSLTTDQASYPTLGQTITADLTAQNNTGSNVTDSYLDYVFFIDANSNHKPDAGETYLTDGCAGSGSWSSGNYTHQTTGFSVNANSSNTDEWSCTNDNFPQNTTYTLWAKWWDGGSTAYDTSYVTFTSVPTLGEVLLIIFIVLVILLVGRLILHFKRKRYWLFYYLGATFTTTIVLVLTLRRFGVDQYLVNAASYHVYLVANHIFGLPLEILSNGRFQLLLSDGGSSILKLGIECSAIIESSLLISLLVFLPIFSLRQRILRASFGLVVTYVINLCRLLIIVLMAYKFGPDYIFLAHALVGRFFFFVAELLLYWYLFTKPMVKAVGDSIAQRMPLARIARSGHALSWRNTYGQAITIFILVAILASSFGFTDKWQKAFVSQKSGENQPSILGGSMTLFEEISIKDLDAGNIAIYNFSFNQTKSINLQVIEAKEPVMIEVYLNDKFQNRTLVKPNQLINNNFVFSGPIIILPDDILKIIIKNTGENSSGYYIEILQ